MFCFIYLLFALVSGLEVDLEWDTSAATQQKAGINTAMSLLRFTQDTSPPGTEWIPLGWEYGSLRIQHLQDSRTKILMELTSPQQDFKVSLGRQSELTQAQYSPDAESATQVVLETIASPWTGSDGLALDANLPYYFKVEAHHDLLLNRTTYEGLFSTGDHWKYLGSLVLQHPHNQTNSPAVSSTAEESTSIKERDEKEDSDDEEANTSGTESETDSDTEESTTKGGRHQLQMYEEVLDSHDDSGSLRDLMREAFGEFLRTEHNHRPRTPQDPSNTVERQLDNGLQYTEVFPFPGLFSGIHRMNDTTGTVRAAVYKKLQLRDRLGQVFAVAQGKAYVYDSTDRDDPHVRNYLAANSFLLTIN